MKNLLFILLFILCSCKMDSNRVTNTPSISPAKELTKADDNNMKELLDLYAYEVDKESQIFSDDIKSIMIQVQAYYNNSPRPLFDTFYTSPSPVGTQFKIIKFNYEKYELDIFRFKKEKSKSVIYKIVKIKYENNKWSISREIQNASM